MLITVNFHLETSDVNSCFYICNPERPINPIIIQKSMERGHTRIFHDLSLINRDKRNVCLQNIVMRHTKMQDVF